MGEVKGGFHQVIIKSWSSLRGVVYLGLPMPYFPSGLGQRRCSHQSLLAFSHSPQFHSMKTGKEQVTLKSALVPMFPWES